MIHKTFTIALMIFVVLMATVQASHMIFGSPRMINLFVKWHIERRGVGFFGMVTFVSALLILFPETYKTGNLLMAATILFLIIIKLSAKDLKAAVIELPFMALNLLLIYLRYPVRNMLPN